MKQTILTLAAALSLTLTAQADDLSLYLEPTAGETTSYAVSTLQKMTFADGNVVLTKKDGTTVTTDITSLKRMYIDAAAGINQLLNNEPAPYTIYNINGIRVADGTAASANDIDLAALQSGLYLVSIKNQTFKILK